MEGGRVEGKKGAREGVRGEQGLGVGRVGGREAWRLEGKKEGS